MTRLFQAASVVTLMVSIFGSVGCVSGDRPGLQNRYDTKVDPCWPERYNFTAREAVIAPFATHVMNGKIIDQTIFNGDFEPGTEKLNAGGLAKLDTIARRRPVDGQLSLQTTRDINYDATKPDEYIRTRSELDAKRIQQIQTYMNASTSGRNLTFDVAVIDPANQTVLASGPAAAVRGYQSYFQGGLTSGTGLSNQGAGGGIVSANITPQANQTFQNGNQGGSQGGNQGGSQGGNQGGSQGGNQGGNRQ